MQAPAAGRRYQVSIHGGLDLDRQAAVGDEERELQALERKWRAVKALIALSVVILAAPAAVGIVQAVQNGAGSGFGGGTLITSSAVIHHNGFWADTLAFAVTVAIDAGLIVFFYRLLDGLGAS